MHFCVTLPFNLKTTRLRVDISLVISNTKCYLLKNPYAFQDFFLKTSGKVKANFISECTKICVTPKIQT